MDDELGAPSAGSRIELASLAERPELLEEFIALDDLWPRFMLQDPFGLLLGRVGLHVADYSFLVLDGDAVLGRAVSVPVGWTMDDDLPTRGWDAAIESAVEVMLSLAEARSMCALEITLHRGTRGTGTSRRVLELMRAEARDMGLEGMLAPVRPTGKAADPTMSMTDYLDRTTRAGADGDPWLGVHQSLGAEVHGIAEVSMTVSATFESWRSWTGLDPDDVQGAEMIVPGGLAPVMLDHGNRTGTYVEPNIWCKHRFDAGTEEAGRDVVIDLREFDSVPVPPEVEHGWRVTEAVGPLFAEAERIEYETFVDAGFCPESPSGRVEAYDRWREHSEFVVVISPDGEVQGAARMLFGPFDSLPVGEFTRDHPYPADPVLEYASLSVRRTCRKTAVSPWLYRAVWQTAIRRGAAGIVAIGEQWLLELLNEAYSFGFRQLGPARRYMGGDCFAMGTDVNALAARMLRQPSLFRWGSDEIDLRDVPRQDMRAAIEELRRG